MLKQTLVVSFSGDKSEIGGLREYVAGCGVDESLLFFSIKARSSFLIPHTRTLERILVVRTLLRGQGPSVNLDGTRWDSGCGRSCAGINGIRNRVSEQSTSYTVNGVSQTSIADHLVREAHCGKSSFGRDEAVMMLVATITRRTVKGNRSHVFNCWSWRVVSRSGSNWGVARL